MQADAIYKQYMRALVPTVKDMKEHECVDLTEDQESNEQKKISKSPKVKNKIMGNPLSTLENKKRIVVLKRSILADEDCSDVDYQPKKKKARKTQSESLFLSMPREILEMIFMKMSHADIAKTRMVCVDINEICQGLLNTSFCRIQCHVQQRFQRIKSQMPRRESARRKHALARECDIIETVHMRLTLLHMTFSKHIDRGHCSFFAGEILDEICRILDYVKVTDDLARAYKVTDELFDLSTMAMEYFKEAVEPVLPEISYFSTELQASLDALTSPALKLTPSSTTPSAAGASLEQDDPVYVAREIHANARLKPAPPPVLPIVPYSPDLCNITPPSLCKQSPFSTKQYVRNKYDKVNLQVGILKRDLLTSKRKLVQTQKQVGKMNIKIKRYDRKFEEQDRKFEEMWRELRKCQDELKWHRENPGACMNITEKKMVL